MHRLSALIVSAAALGACAAAPPSLSPESAMSPPSAPPAPSVPAAADPLPEASVPGPFGTQLLVAFDVRPGRLVADVRYVLRNTGPAPLIVFDRGTAHDVGTGSQVLGAVGVPAQEIAGEDVTLVHAATPLPEPSPTSPPTPLGIELAPGAALPARFQVMLQGPALPARLRWCVGVMPVDEGLLSAPQQTPEGRIWTASFAVVQRQARLCTPWYDVAGARFEPG